MSEPATAPQHGALREVAWLFLKLGATAFGGPAAHIAMMEHEVVRRRQWLTREEFLDMLGATNLIPGPNSTEMAIHLGHRRAGWAGLVVAGGAFILPAFLIVLGIAWAYVRYGKLPQAHAILYGVKPVVISIVVQALWGLGRSAIKTRFLALVGSVAVVLSFAGVNELAVLFGLGLFSMLWRNVKRWQASRVPPSTLLGIVPALASTSAPAVVASGAMPFGLSPLFLFFLKIGSVLFGSGYVLLAFLRADLVERWGWLTEAQLLDAVAIGQVTPGPVFTTATFIGYVLGGSPGAIVATIGIFLPAFTFVAISGPLVPRLRRSPTAGSFLDGVNVASLALMLVVTWQLGAAALVDWITLTLAIISAILLIRWRVNSAWLVLGGAMVGLLVSSLPKP
ncbi:chromate efflux transporter [Verrucomicrobiota bacterium sgz303538]